METLMMNFIGIIIGIIYLFIFCGMVEMRLALFPARTIVRNLHHCESPTRREQGLNLR